MSLEDIRLSARDQLSGVSLQVFVWDIHQLPFHNPKLTGDQSQPVGESFQIGQETNSGWVEDVCLDWWAGVFGSFCGAEAENAAKCFCTVQVFTEHLLQLGTVMDK